MVSARRAPSKVGPGTVNLAKVEQDLSFSLLAGSFLSNVRLDPAGIDLDPAVEKPISAAQIDILKALPAGLTSPVLGQNAD
ncbi:MAG TPA: hypothetical protein VGN18_07895 [Jatrophihabitans sp.]|jgi:hypothetical protein|uniref:hypothetical protein n=1 Tax=Jatrophihabitans sp. TaxID=1932789 RepID=UPI002E07CB54|nr:hypothetical protein [Jatrophihabitans sp.]